MKRLTLLLALIPCLAFAQTERKAQATSQRGSGAKGEETATPGPGLEAGAGNGMAGGRTDLGPTGVTGMVSGAGASHEQALAKANDQARGENEKGSFLRPAETPAQLELNPRVMGSGAEYGAFAMGGRYYFDGHAARGKVTSARPASIGAER
jgi:hypothetical protein